MEHTYEPNRKELDRQWNEMLDGLRHARDLQSRYGDVTLTEVISCIGDDLSDFISDHPEYDPSLNI